MDDKVLRRIVSLTGAIEIDEEALWMVDHNELSYNTDASKDDLFDGDGDTYSGYVKSRWEVNEYTIFNYDTQCGYDQVVVFLTSNEVHDI